MRYLTRLERTAIEYVLQNEDAMEEVKDRKLDDFRIAEESGKPLAIPVGGMIITIIANMKEFLITALQDNARVIGITRKDDPEYHGETDLDSYIQICILVYKKRN
jgi:hypothetical protein